MFRRAAVIFTSVFTVRAALKHMTVVSAARRRQTSLSEHINIVEVNYSAGGGCKWSLQRASDRPED